MLLITALAALIDLCVLGSLWRSGMPGIREAMGANVATIVAMLFMVQQASAPPWLGVLLANLLFTMGGVLFVAALRRFLDQPVPWRPMLGGVAVLMVALAYYTYISPDVSARIVLASLMYTSLLALLAWSVWRSRRQRFAYSQIFMLSLALVAILGHGTRMAVYALGVDAIPGLLAPTVWNIVFLSLGVVIMPSLTLGMIMMIHDRMLIEREREANTDFLTGVLSRKAWWQGAQRLGARAGRPLALLILDIDHFKQVNDSMGHAAGDAVLRHFAAVASAALRPGDALGRLGGEEFIAALPGASAQEAQALAARMLAALDAMPCQYGDIQLRYTFSGGVSSWDGAEALQTAVQRADQALYRAKAGGRSRVDLACPV
ncbi:signaling protein [Bordetella pseudohinzii]|uniref:diguanylate cyclase n=1 Tax=Bordetella pseudohinzii TaxID=1331258 RepID=A0ABN4RXA8_9BORD|nr:signaling protein [Bordetella pseudohinzii]KMM24558.1 signaling protein [Bordetella pseudohinzii]KXA76616.1 signaling protein [Bordetella pseudohinzii]KXA76965.1 signaling protein [Bordetella pseudohinzii]